MKIEIEIDSGCKEPKLIIRTAAITEEINLLIKRLSLDSPQLLTGLINGELVVLEQEHIVRFYSENGKVFARDDKHNYAVKQRLYELEEMLDKKFVRISNSEIINLKKAKRFDLSITGTIRVNLSNGDYVFVSRRYVSKIKQLLGV
ncbi:MAG: LytTR family DNA-binding domain-containing protein [Clostridia bacterium]|nr:LytTR family DNA-binding domain-containing protein [Clostridia bacterium]